MDKKIPTEEWEQAKVIRWKRANQIKHSELQLMHGSIFFLSFFFK